MNKKGNAVLDTITVVIVLFVFAILSVVGYLVFGDLNTDLQADTDISDTAKETASGLYDRYPGAMDGLYVFIFALIWAMALVASFMIDAHPIFFAFMLILMIVILYVGAELSNAYEELGEEEDLDIDSFPMTKYIQTHLVEFMIAIGATIGLVLYGKNKYMGG